MAIDRDHTNWRDMHDRILGVKIIVVAGITGTGIEEGYAIEKANDLAMGMSKNDDLCIRKVLPKGRKRTIECETMAGIME